MLNTIPSRTAVEEQLALLLGSKALKKALKARALLELLVIGYLEGKPPSEKTIGIRLFGWQKDWEPTEERSNVRTALSRLRKKLDKYYEKEGTGDPVRIEIDVVEVKATNTSPLPALQTSPAPVGDALDAVLRGYFADPDSGNIRCVVSGEPAEWHYFNGDPCLRGIGNIIPLCERLRSHIENMRGRKATIAHELEPHYLADVLARRNAANWRMASAYGCAHLAFHMGSRPFGNESADVRIQRLCDVLSHTGHHFNEPLVAYIIRHDLLPIVAGLRSLDPRPMFNLALQLASILDAAGYSATAKRAFLVAKRLADRFGALVCHPDSLNRFALLRRQLQQFSVDKRSDDAFEALRQQAEEQAHNNSNLPLVLQFVTTVRRLRQGTIGPARQTYAALLPLVEDLNSAVFGGAQVEKPPGVDLSNLALMFIFATISASRTAPNGWEDYAREMLAKAKHLCRESGYGISREFWETASEGTFDANPRARRVLLLPASCLVPSLRESAKTDINAILFCLYRISVAEKAEEALTWKSPWSKPKTTLPGTS